MASQADIIKGAGSEKRVATDTGEPGYLTSPEKLRYLHPG